MITSNGFSEHDVKVQKRFFGFTIGLILAGSWLVWTINYPLVLGLGLILLISELLI